VLIALAQPVAAQDFAIGKAAYDRADYETALRKWKILADRGNAKAQNALGILYQRGHGVSQNVKKAIRLYLKAADQGYSKAHHNLGLAYAEGTGVDQDFKKAAQHYLAAAEKGVAKSQVNLAFLYNAGVGVPKSHENAFRWNREAAVAGHAQAQNNLGVMYETGKGVDLDVMEAVRWFRRSAEQGDSYGQYNLGRSYDQGLGVTKNSQEGILWYRKAADQGHVGGQYNLALMYANGDGVPEDKAEAVRWYRKAADQGDEDAKKALSDLGVTVASGSRKSQEKEQHETKKTAEMQLTAMRARDRQTQFRLATLGYYKGKIDGLLGPASRTAISVWQAAQGYTATGKLSDAQFASLTGDKVQVAASAPAPVTPPRTSTANKHAVAVILGNRDYGDPVPDVDYATNDADAMRRFVVEQLGYRDGNIIDLRDAGQAELIATFGNEKNHHGKLWQLVRASKSDVTVFYSGHGVPGLRDKKGYLLPVDADPDAVELNGYPLDDLLNNLAKINARSMTVYLDACFSGESAKGMLIQAVSGLSVEPRMPATSSGMTVITAATGDQVASWDKKAKHGLFTKHLLDALTGAADKGDYGNGDGKVTVGEVKRYLDDEMTYAAQRNYGRVQTATIKGDADTVLAVIR
jgi:TPR repeat protein